MLTVAEAAARKGVAVQTIRAAIARGDILAERHGARLLMVSEKSLDKWTPILSHGWKRKENKHLRRKKKSDRKT